MNITVNEEYLRRQRRSARLRSTAGLALVLASFLLSLFMGAEYWLVFLAYPALIVGFPLWQSGRGAVRRWDAAIAAPKVVLDEVRPGPKQQLYAYPRINGEVIDYLLVAPEGLMIIALEGLNETPKATFPVTVRQVKGEDRWRQTLPILERLARLGEPRLGNPTRKLDRQIAAVQAWLAELNVTHTAVRGVVVFRLAETPLDIEESKYEVLHLNMLRSFLSLGQYFDEPMRATITPVEERNRINTALGALMGPAAAAVRPGAIAAPVRKLSPEARAEQARVREIRAARAAEASAPRPAAKAGAAARPPGAPPPNGAAGPGRPPKGA
jgi:hypothetical protein